MDFSVCPSCHQSVLEDDAVDCPFCGASMKGKPGAKPAPAATKSASVASKPVGAKPVVAKPTLPGDDLPFESELTTGKAAIPAMPNPTKQRSLQVICPMCDTPGYIPPTAAGQTVRCANAKCVMPVFTAPAVKKKEEAPPPPPPKSSNLPMIGAITLVAMLLFGGGLYFVFFQSSGPRKKELSEEDKRELAEMIGGTKKSTSTNVGNTKTSSGDGNPTLVTGDGNTKSVTGDKPAALTEELIKSALKQLKDSSLANEKQRSKPFCRQLAAEANAVTGNVVAAREHLEQLIKVGPEVSYYRIVPLLDLFWIELNSGNKKEAATTLKNAMSEVPKIPKFGRTRLEIAGRLAASLAAAGRIPEALTMLTSFQSADSEAQLAARLQMATDGRVARLSDTASVLPWKFPQAVAATASLINRGDLKTAAAWAAAQLTDDAKAECLAIWAQEIAHREAPAGEADFDGTIATAIERLEPPFAARIWARAGCGRLLAKDRAGVEAAIKLAQEKLATVSVPADLTMPDVKAVQRFKLPPAESLLQAATAAGEIAFLQAQTLGTKADAEKSLDLALSYVRATAPTNAAAQQRQADANSLGPGGLRDLLKKELKLKSDDEARTAAGTYNRVLNKIVEASQQRFDIETQLLSRLRGAGVGLNSKVWIIVSTRSTADDINQRDNFFATGLPGELVEGLKGTDEERAILGAWGLRSREPAPPRPAFVEFNDLLKTNVSSAVEFVQTVDTKLNRREEVLLRTASRLSTTGKLSTAFQFISKLDDMVAREDCYRLAAALAAQRGESEVVWKQVSLVQQHTEKSALCRGLVAGLQAIGKPIEDFPDPMAPPLRVGFGFDTLLQMRSENINSNRQ